MVPIIEERVGELQQLCVRYRSHQEPLIPATR